MLAYKAESRLLRPMSDPATTTVPADPLSAPFPSVRRESAGRQLFPILLRPLYRLYEERLLFAIRAWPLPRHIGIILDGNRRYARQRGITDPRTVYDIGARKLDDVLD